MITQLVNGLAGTLGVTGNAQELVFILKQTAFKQREGKEVSDAQMAALMMVAKQYGLNPFIKEIYAFADKSGGISPIVGVDGWVKIINNHPQFDGMDFVYSENSQPVGIHATYEWIECRIYRRDRTRPTIIREYFTEVFRGGGDKPTPWDTHPARFHRHKAMIQCARVAFGFAGIMEADEAPPDLELVEGLSPPPPATAALPRRRSEVVMDVPAVNVHAGPAPMHSVDSMPTAAAPMQRQAPTGEASGARINPGQVKFLQQRVQMVKAAVERRGDVIDIIGLLAKHGVEMIDESVTVEQLANIREDLDSLL